jgi:hypothetical protein
VPALGLPQGSCYRRHATLCLAWWRQTVPGGGLHQGSRSSSRQRVLLALSTEQAARRCIGGRTVAACRAPGAPSHQCTRREGRGIEEGELRRSPFGFQERHL